jgi:ketosteroid isomerase-like protein
MINHSLKLLAVSITIALISGPTTPPSRAEVPSEPTTMSNKNIPADLQRLIERYRLAQKEFVRGNPQPFKELCSHADDVTIAGGWGGVEKGWFAQVEKRYDWASARFASDDDDQRQIESISFVATSEMAYAVDIERSKIRLAGSGQTGSLALRVTTIFRRENDQWKLTHRHADPLVDVQSPASVLKR